MSKISDDYEFFVEKAAPIVVEHGFIDWSMYGELYSIPWDGIDFLREYPSFSAYGGRLLIGDPEVFSGILPLIFGGDPDFHHRDTIVVGHSAFARVFCWNKKYGSLEIDLSNATILCGGLLRPERLRARPDIIFRLIFRVPDMDALDIDDEEGKLLFERAKKKLGALDYRKCYGFSLSLPLGGYRTLDKLEKLSAPEHYSLLAQLQPFTLIDWGTTSDFGLREIRQIG